MTDLRPPRSRGSSIFRFAAELIAVLIAVLTTQTVAWTQDRVPVDDDGRIVDFSRDIVPIFRDHCYECHNAKEAKADFRIDDQETVFSYVEPEDLESSSMYFDYLLSEDPDMLMPPPSKGGPLGPEQLALIRVWIEEGADWPEGATVQPSEAGSTDAEPAVEEATAPTGLMDRLWAFQGFLHPATVHFPIALFLFGALFVVLGWKWPVLGEQIPLACLLLGAPTAIAATAMGWSFATEQGYGSWTKVDFDSEVFWHRWSGIIVTVVSVVMAFVALAGLKGGNERLQRIWKIGLLVIAGMVGAVGHQGGEMSYGEDFYPKAFRILLGTEGEVAVEDGPDESAEEDSSDASLEAGEADADAADADVDAESDQSVAVAGASVRRH